MQLIPIPGNPQVAMAVVLLLVLVGGQLGEVLFVMLVTLVLQAITAAADAVKSVAQAARKPRTEPKWRGEHSWNELQRPPRCNWCELPRTAATEATPCAKDARLPR